MELKVTLAQEFASTVLTGIKDIVKKEKRSEGHTVYGTVVSKSNKTAMVRLDGADPDDPNCLTPAALANDAVEGDRVAVQIKNRKAVVTGNITSPANATVGDFYMELTTDGLNIGKKDGNYISVGDDTFRFCDHEGNVLATMKLSDTNFGQAMMILASILGLRSERGNDAAEVITMATASETAAVMQVRSNGAVSSSLRVDKTGAFANGTRILTASNLACTGVVTATGTVQAGRSAVLSTNADIPTGFIMLGLSSVNVARNTGARSRFLRMSRFTTSRSGAINITVTNDNTSDMAAQVTVTWFALRADEVANAGSKSIDLIVDD